MSLTTILFIYAILFIVACLAFVEQRAELEIGRVIGFDLRTVMLPMWCVASSYSWVVVAGLAIYTFMYYSWTYAIGMLAAYFIVPGFMPISDSAYERVYKGIAELTKQNTVEASLVSIKIMGTPIEGKVAKYK